MLTMALLRAIKSLPRRELPVEVHARTWPRWEGGAAAAQDPQQQTVRMVHAAFDALMDALEAQHAAAAAGGGGAAAAAAALAACGSARAFQEAAAAELMALGAPRGSMTLALGGGGEGRRPAARLRMRLRVPSVVRGDGAPAPACLQALPACML
jgi:hypothetical protein